MESYIWVYLFTAIGHILRMMAYSTVIIVGFKAIKALNYYNNQHKQ